MRIKVDIGDEGKDDEDRDEDTGEDGDENVNRYRNENRIGMVMG